MNKIITIEGMMCQNCVRHVTESLTPLGSMVNVTLETKKAFLRDAKVSNEELTKIIEDLGYEVIDIIDN